MAQGDGWVQNLGVRVLVGEMIRQGEWPLWNPYIFAGTPLLASIYPGALYPPNWLFALFSPGVAMNLAVLTTYHLALIGTYLYARRIGCNRLGALIAGTAFTFGGYLLAHMGHTSRIAAAVWLPWILLAIETTYQHARWRWVWLGALFIALQLFAGEPQMTLYTGLLSAAYCLFTLLARLRQERWRFAVMIGVMAVSGALLSAVQLFPERELLAQGERATINYDFFSAFSFPPRQMLTLIFPYFFGGAAKAPYSYSWWGQGSPGETCGYIGLLTLLLGLVALCARTRLAGFWAGCAVGALLLAFGSYLPFGINHLLHHLPVFNLFRASARHLFEFTFCLSILAGLGTTYISSQKPELVRRAALRASGLMTAALLLTTVAYRFFTHRLAAVTPPTTAGSLLRAEALVPLACFALGLMALWFYFRRQGILAGATLFAVLLIDLVSFGHFFHWRTVTFSINDRLADPPSVQYIKARERDLNSFRILSHSIEPFGWQYEALNYPNVSVTRGLQSVNGYDALRLLSMTTLAGEMAADGLVTEASALGLEHRGFDLLNVKYLLRERPALFDQEHSVGFDGVRFHQRPLDLELKPGMHIEMMPDGSAATELVIISNMANSALIADNTPMVRFRLHTKGGGMIERELLAGRDTAEWAYDRADVRAVIKHRRAPVITSEAAEGFQSHRYLAHLRFERAEVERIETEYLRPDAMLILNRAALYDATTDASTPLDLFGLSPERWRRLESFGPISLYENLKLMPRAWLANKTVTLPRNDVLHTIKTGRLPNGALFDPASTVLLEGEVFSERLLSQDSAAPDAEANVLLYKPHRIEVSTHNTHPSWLVLSEITYPGWEAFVDGRSVPVERVNYTLRGIELPSGKHKIEFLFRPHSFRTGAAWSACGIVLLLLSSIIHAGWRGHISPRRREPS